MQDPSLRRVTGRVNGAQGLKSNEFLRVELVENPRGSGMIISADVAPDGAFEIKNVSPRTYQAIVLKTCKGCNYSTGVGNPITISIGDKDVTDLRLEVRRQ
jgi:hypothetical protein